MPAAVRLVWPDYGSLGLSLHIATQVLGPAVCDVCRAQGFLLVCQPILAGGGGGYFENFGSVGCGSPGQNLVQELLPSVDHGMGVPVDPATVETSDHKACQHSGHPCISKGMMGGLLSIFPLWSSRPSWPSAPARVRGGGGREGASLPVPRTRHIHSRCVPT